MMDARRQSVEETGSTYHFTSDWWRILLLWIVTLLIRYFIALVVLVGFCQVLNAQSPGTERSPFRAGEELRYKVRWSFIRIGTINIRQDYVKSDSSKYIFTMHVQSASGLPFINVDFINESVKSPSSLFVTTERIVSGKDRAAMTVYTYDPVQGTIEMVDSIQGRQVQRQTLETSTPCFDALGLWMLARTYSGSRTSFVLPTLNDYQVNVTELTLTRDYERLEVPALPSALRSVRLAGMAHWEGKSFAGLKGTFRAWLSDDDAAIPLRAEMEIFLGSIVLELESYSRVGWQSDSIVQNVSIKAKEQRP